MNLSLGYAQTNGVFKLVDTKKNSDINYLTIKNINSLGHIDEEMLQNFKPVKGQYTTYTFIKEFIGYSVDGFDVESYKEVQMHDIIVLKTNSDNIILDGFYYRLEWREVPSQSMIFRVFAQGVKLKNNLKVSELEMYNEWEVYNPDGSSESELRKLDWCNDDVLEF